MQPELLEEVTELGSSNTVLDGCVRKQKGGRLKYWYQ